MYQGRRYGFSPPVPRTSVALCWNVTGYINWIQLNHQNNSIDQNKEKSPKCRLKLPIKTKSVSTTLDKILIRCLTAIIIKSKNCRQQKIYASAKIHTHVLIKDLSITKVNKHNSFVVATLRNKAKSHYIYTQRHQTKRSLYKDN